MKRRRNQHIQSIKTVRSTPVIIALSPFTYKCSLQSRVTTWANASQRKRSCEMGEEDALIERLCSNSISHSMYLHSISLSLFSPHINELYSGHSIPLKSRGNDIHDARRDGRVRSDSQTIAPEQFTYVPCHAMGTPAEEYYQRFIRGTAHGY